MIRTRLAFCLVLLFLLALAINGASFETFVPAQRTLMFAHNVCPGQWPDRFERALSTGMPLVIELDPGWVLSPKSGKNECFLCVNAKSKNITGNEPTLKSFFFERVRPIVEKALKDNNKKSWPLIIAHLDIGDNAPELLESISKQIAEYEDWLTTAVKTNNPADKPPLDVKPLMILAYSYIDDNKVEYFYNRLPVGGKIHVFGTAKLSMPPGEGLTPKQIKELRFPMNPEELVKEPASNYRRWWHNSWAHIEGVPAKESSEWTADKEARLKAFVTYGHKLGYLVSFYCLNGIEPEAGKTLGWNAEYNFGSLEKATIRWKAAVKAGVDFLSTDQFEDVAKVLKSGR